MPKRVQDIIPGNHRTIREIPVESTKNVVRGKNPRIKKEKVVEEVEEEEEEVAEQAEEETVIEEKPIIREKKVAINRLVSAKPAPAPAAKPKKSFKKGSKIIVTFLAVILLVGVAGYFASVYFARAVFTIKARDIPVSVNNTLIASPTSVNGSLSYELVSLRDAASTTVAATIGGYTESKAKGIMTIYNAYIAKPWKLIAGTRFITDDGNIYLLTSTITIPAYTKSSDGTLVPGTIVATLIADKAGDKYNIETSGQMQKLHIVAYKNSSKYESVYAKTTSPIRGGFAGNKVTVSPTLLASTTANLQAQLLSSAFANIKNSVPEGYILFDTLRFSNFDAPVVTNTKDKTATISVQGTVFGVMFKKSDLVPKLAGESMVQSFKGLEYDTPGLENVTINVSNSKDFSPVKKNTLIVQAKGTMNLVGKIPVDELKTKFAGMALSDTQNVIRSYASIINLDKSSGQVVPPWSKIPKNTDRIMIKVN